jgi:hypothetical protein
LLCRQMELFPTICPILAGRLVMSMRLVLALCRLYEDSTPYLPSNAFVCEIWTIHSSIGFCS